MKYSLPIILILVVLLSFPTFSQNYTVGLYCGFGANILDVEESQGWELEEWDNYSIMPTFEALINLDDKFLIGGELGAHRHYYWERRESGTGYFYWGTIWTYNFGALAEYLVTDKLRLKSGLGFRVFSDGSGSSPGIMAAFDYSVVSFDKLNIPLGLRVDAIPANAFTTSVNITAGVRLAP